MDARGRKLRREVLESGGSSMTPRCVVCIEEGVTTERPTPHGGPRSPRCVTHERARKKRVKARGHELRTKAKYGISLVQYWVLYHFQGGKCAICQKATGKTKRLAVDHDHKLCDTHPPEKGCPVCVRGLLCGPCNTTLIGRYDAEALRRAIDYLEDPPARKVLAQ